MKKLFFLILNLFRKQKEFSLGLYGPPNAGKSTLANTIIKDILGEDAKITFSTSEVEHETRSVQKVEELTLERASKKINFALVDTPGIATKIDFEDFIKKGMKKQDAKDRAREATQGVIESIRWVEKVDCVLVVLDATINPYSQVNITLIGNLVAKDKKIIIVANKIDLKNASVDKIKLVFADYPIVGVSAKTGDNLEELYREVFKQLN
ncbi:MAG: Era-like GTP-binding protein [Candidatus Woesearchaeota archaeon]